jgi:hypothetical protein
MNTVKRSPLPLRDVLYEFSLAKDVPDAELLDHFVKLYSEYASEITDFAIEVVAESLRHHVAQAVDTPTVVSPAVSRAMSTYQNALFAKAAKTKAATIEESPATQSSEVPNLFAALDRNSFRALAAALSMNNVFLMKLRDHQIDPATITGGFRDFVAEKLRVARAVVDSYFAQSSPQLAPQFFKSDAKPETQTQQNFTEAVRGSGLSDTQQTFLLEL